MEEPMETTEINESNNEFCLKVSSDDCNFAIDDPSPMNPCPSDTTLGKGHPKRKAEKSKICRIRSGK